MFSIILFLFSSWSLRHSTVAHVSKCSCFHSLSGQERFTGYDIRRNQWRQHLSHHYLSSVQLSEVCNMGIAQGWKILECLETLSPIIKKLVILRRLGGTQFHWRPWIIAQARISSSGGSMGISLSLSDRCKRFSEILFSSKRQSLESLHRISRSGL